MLIFEDIVGGVISGKSSLFLDCGIMLISRVIVFKVTAMRPGADVLDGVVGGLENCGRAAMTGM